MPANPCIPFDGTPDPMSVLVQNALSFQQDERTHIRLAESLCRCAVTLIEARDVTDVRTVADEVAHCMAALFDLEADLEKTAFPTQPQQRLVISPEPPSPFKTVYFPVRLEMSAGVPSQELRVPPPGVKS